MIAEETVRFMPPERQLERALAVRRRDHELAIAQGFLDRHDGRLTPEQLVIFARAGAD